MTPNELRRFREVQRLRRECREMEIMLTIWGIMICAMLFLIPNV